MNMIEALRRPRVALVASRGDAFDAMQEIEDAVHAALPRYSFALEESNGRIVIPASDRIMFDGRFLRVEEEEEFEKAVDAAVAAIADASVLYAFEEMCFFDWNLFAAADFERLGRAYATMPGWIPDRPFATWFSADESEPHVWGSVEPPGLQIEAILDPSAFARWRAALLERTRDFPFRTDGWLVCAS